MSAALASAPIRWDSDPPGKVYTDAMDDPAKDSEREYRPFRAGLRAVRYALPALPWLLSTYALYWLEYGGIWQVDAPYRGLASLLILAAGLFASFLVYRALVEKRH
jgi:hypothetical protein